MQSVSDRAAPATWTGEVIPRGGRLLDLEALAQAVRSVGEPFSLRGVEATIDGELVEQDGQLALRVPGAAEILPLAPLTRKVQWNPPLKQPQAITEPERTAYDRLVAQRPARTGRVRVVGPLVPGADGRAAALEVRKFAWRP